MATTDREFQDLAGRVGELERGQQKMVEQINRTLQHAKDYDSGLTKRLENVERRLDTTIDQLNKVLQHAKNYDSGLDKRLASVEQSVKDLGKRGNTEPPMTKREVATMIDASKGTVSNLEKDLNNQINNLKKQVDNLARNAKR